MEFKWEALKGKAKKEVSRRMHNNHSVFMTSVGFAHDMVEQALGQVLFDCINGPGHAPNPEKAVDQMLTEWEEAALKVIENWDARQVGKLIQLFPKIVPAKHRSASMTAELVDNAAGDDCEWVVFFSNPD